MSSATRPATPSASLSASSKPASSGQRRLDRDGYRLRMSEGRSPGQRMAWLDALRAVAALLVVYAHITRYVFEGARTVTADWLNAGPAGVMLFFLVSGYIIPASLERRGSLRGFWVSRVFRLFPLYLVVCAAVIVGHIVGLVPVEVFLFEHPVTALTAHLTMLPFVLGVPLVTAVIWTLTYEMSFYLLVSGLFAIRRPRAGWVVALALAVVAVTVPLTPKQLPVERTVTVVAVLLVCGLVGLSSGKRWAVIASGLTLGVMSLSLLLFDQDPAHVWDGLLIIAVMFVGTTIYRAQQGQASWWLAALVSAIVAAALLDNWFAELRSLDSLTLKFQARSVITLVVFAGAFAVGMLTRRVRTPRALAWLGVISYSIYLVHYVLITLLGPLLTRLGHRLALPGQLLVLVGYLALVIGLSWLTHRYIELPGQRAGKRLSDWMTARWGTDAEIEPEIEPEVAPPAAVLSADRERVH
jgi:peptidoglycan/LPS O-acetylase OafA/YrhL